MNEVFCVMECHDGDINDILPSLVTIYSTFDKAMEFIDVMKNVDDKVILRVERWDVDGVTSETMYPVKEVEEIV